MSISGPWWLFLLALASAQLVALASLALTHAIVWRIKRNKTINFILGLLSLMLLSLFLLLASWITGGWSDWDEAQPPDFLNLTWPYFFGAESVFLLVTWGIAWLHRRQFDLPLSAGWMGFCLDVVATFTLPLIFGTIVVNRYWNQLSYFTQSSNAHYFYGAFWISYLVLWLILTLFRPTVMRGFQRVSARWPKSKNN